jgi:hypothetical protein
MRARHAALAFILLAAAPASGSAQRWIILDAGAGASSHQFASSGTTFSIAPRLLWLGHKGRLDIGALYSRGTTLGWNTETNGSGGWMIRPGGPITVDLGAEGFWTRHRRGPGTSELVFRPSVRVEGRRSHLALTLGAGRAQRHAGPVSLGLERGADTLAPPVSMPSDSNEIRTFTRGSLDGATTLGPFDLRGRITRTRFTERALRAGTFWTRDDPRQDTLFRRYVTQYDDVSIGVGWANRTFRIDGALQQRLGLQEFRSRAWHLEMAAQVSPDLTLFGSTGRTLSRITVDLPARGYTTAGIRWAIGGRRTPPARADHNRAHAAFLLEREGELVHLLVRSEHASRVEIAGDFSDWEPVALSPAREGWWAMSRPLAPGLYHVNVRYDGGAWLAPAGLPTERDEFGGSVGVLVVP